MSRKILGPFNRVEGDLEVILDIAEGKISSASVKAPLYRGFEQILQGHPALDALVIAPRICGICSVAQSTAAARALAAASRNGVGETAATPNNGHLIANLMLATENVADHLTHFYLYFMPDFARKEYSGKNWYAEIAQRFTAMRGSAVQPFLSTRSEWMRIMGIVAGKWPHSLALQPGGSSRPLQVSEIFRLQQLLRGMVEYLQKEIFADQLENLTALTSVEELLQWAQQHNSSDFARFIQVAQSLDLHRLGNPQAGFMSGGAYAGLGGASSNQPGQPFKRGQDAKAKDSPSNAFFPAGVAYCQPDGVIEWQDLEIERINEDVSHAWYMSAGVAQTPELGSTLPEMNNALAYTWCKAPRYAGQRMEVGALARQVIARQALALDFVRQYGSSVMARVSMRLLELAYLLPAMQQWAETLQAGAPYCVSLLPPENARSYALVEAARGTLGYWLDIRYGHIHNIQIIAPTTWNFSPRSVDGQPGPLEQALTGIESSSEASTSLLAEHITRSFDPCMACTVH